MKSLLTLALAFSLAPLLPTLAADEPKADAPKAPAPAAPAADPNAYWDPTIVPGVTPYPLTGTDLKGKTISLADYAGKPVLIDFWATWCGPCKAELPNVISTYNKYHDQGFEILSVSLDFKKEALATYLEAHKDMPWAQVYDRDLGDKSNAKRYGVQAIPFVLLIGKDGKVAAVNPRGEELEPALKAALAAKPVATDTTATAATKPATAG